MLENGKTMPSVDAWLREAKADSSAPACGMYLTHNGVVRATPKAEARGIGYVRVWLASGELAVGDDIMLVLIGGDIRPHVVDALQALVGTIKNECVSEVEREA